ncbi:MAG: VTT domain-containing protein [Candidatus Kapaibacterium sp.]|jgi:membrane protein YqaA with SNARE-associated domain|nr:VTT domain-containing protein [Candidatus Kapabacteria bacterium]
MNKITKPLVDMMRRMKEWMESFAERPGAMYILAGLAFIESSFFPLPPDILLIAIAVSAPSKALKAAAWCSLGSVFGGIFGYYIGYGLMETIGLRIVDFYNAHEIWAKLTATFQGEVGFWFLAGAAFTPIPYKIATIAAGATHMPIVEFILISSLGRAGRFFLVATVIYLFGPKTKELIDKYFDKLSLAFLALLILGFVAVKYVI